MTASTDLVTAIGAFKTLMNGVLSADPGGTAGRIRSVDWGQGAPSQFPIPFLALQLMSAKRTGSVDGKNEWTVTIKARVMFHVSRHAKAQDDAVRYTSQIENLIDGWVATGVEGGENGDWSYTLPPEPTHGSDAYAEAMLSFKVQTARGAN